MNYRVDAGVLADLLPAPFRPQIVNGSGIAGICLTSSVLNVLAGGRLFPGIHHRAHFDVVERNERFRVEVNSMDGSTHVLVDGVIAEALAPGSVFPSADDASRFFQAGSLGYSPAPKRDRYEGLELRSLNWHVQPLDVGAVESSFFENRTAFPKGSVAFDSALLMRGIEHEWHCREPLACVCTATDGR